MDIDAWCHQEKHPKGAIVPTADFWSVAKVWYANRFDPDWTPRSRQEAQEILGHAGLTGPFWELPAP